MDVLVPVGEEVTCMVRESLIFHKSLTVLLDTMEASNLARLIRSVCDFKSFQSKSLLLAIKRNGNLPEVTINGFYMPSYGAGRSGPTYFNPNKSYMGFIILAINHKTKWYTDPNSPFR